LRQYFRAAYVRPLIVGCGLGALAGVVCALGEIANWWHFAVQLMVLAAGWGVLVCLLGIDSVERREVVRRLIDGSAFRAVVGR
jgi:hypothetical protein